MLGAKDEKRKKEMEEKLKARGELIRKKEEKKKKPKGSTKTNSQVIRTAELYRRLYLRASILAWLMVLIVIPAAWYIYWGKFEASFDLEDIDDLHIFVGSCNIHIVNSEETKTLKLDSWLPVNIRSYI